MRKFISFRPTLLISTCVLLLVSLAHAENFNIPRGDLDSALEAYMTQSGVTLVMSNEAVRGVKSPGVKGDLSSTDALVRILSGTGFVPSRNPSGVVEIVRGARSSAASSDLATHVAAASAPTASGASLETVTVTSSKIGGDVQNIPISITALSQEQLTATQTAGGPDLIKQVPNMTFTKTNFSGYSIQLRGIGTQAISVTTDPAVAVAFNDTPFIRNHFFEQEFYDVSQVEVLRGPQGTLYGRNATAGVVNLVSAKPSDQFEAMASVDIGNYQQRRLEGMLNVPLVDDRVDIRVAGEWTKRQGYSFNELTDARIDGRDLWSSRVTIGLKPIPKLQAYFVWERFYEDDDRLRSSKQLCKTDPTPTEVDGVPVPNDSFIDGQHAAYNPKNYLGQGCIMSSLYSPDAFEVPNGLTLPYVTAAEAAGYITPGVNPYAEATQSSNLRVIESQLNPAYKAKNDTLELNADYALTPTLTFTSQSAFNNDFLWSTEDYNRFNTTPGIFADHHFEGPGGAGQPVSADLAFCDPQLGCSNRLVGEDLSDEHAWQASQEFRLTSNFTGPLNFSVGGNYLHYETEENYYVFVNALTLYSLGGTDSPSAEHPYIPGVTDNSACRGDIGGGGGYQYGDPSQGGGHPFQGQCVPIDPNPIPDVDNEGHNYFLSQNPYLLNSYAAFGEAYYNVLSDLKLTTGLRWTEDQKHFTLIPSQLVTTPYGYPSSGVVNQQWDQFTGRAAVNWTPKLDFTDQTLIYASYAHGYKAGGANPPGAVLLVLEFDTDIGNPIHPLTFKPEFVDAFELGSKNTLLDGALTLNGDVFYYNYENYQISRIVDRTSINDNFDAHIKGAELEGTWEPAPGLRFNFAGGWEDTALAKGSQSVDLMDRADVADHPGWMVVKPSPTQASNCILPDYVVAQAMQTQLIELVTTYGDLASACGAAYGLHVDPLTKATYVANPSEIICGNDGSMCPNTGGYPGFNPLTAPNNGQGFDKNISGNQLPNAPPFTVSAGSQYTMPLSSDWAGTLRDDFYWQDSSWARVFNDNPYDRIHGYTNLNLTLIFTNQNGWQVMLYDKNVFNTTAVTGTFLNSDDSGLTTNVFLTDPKLIGIRVTKNW
jgi:iron complex outermembrane receptor protein